jgi:threonine dehydratase
VGLRTGSEQCIRLVKAGAGILQGLERSDRDGNGICRKRDLELPAAIGEISLAETCCNNGRRRNRRLFLAMLIPKQDIETAVARIRPHLPVTPLVRAEHFSRKLGASVFFKLETLQPTHSFKVRGAFNALMQLPDEQKKRGVVTASGGNHGLAVAYAAQVLGIPATIYLPESATEAKLAAIRLLRPEIIIHGAAWDDANALAMRVARESGRTYVHPFDDRAVMAGQGTIVPELLQQLPAPALIVASIGGGGLISGIISATKHFSPATRVVGVETVGADSMFQSWKAGRIIELPAITSIAETLGARKTEPAQFEIVSRHANDLVTVSDDSAIQALLQILDKEKLLTEPATSCSVAALVEGCIAIRPGENVVVVLCGANVALENVRCWAAGARLDG